MKMKKKEKLKSESPKLDALNLENRILLTI